MTPNRFLGIALISLAVTIWVITFGSEAIEKGKMLWTIATVFLFVFVLITLVSLGAIMIIRG